MIFGAGAFEETGMPEMHSGSIQEVSDRTGHAIMFRAVGKQSTRLLEEGYAAKGFRIDTKSCDWGPMRGFVCVDPRLSKVVGSAAKVADNLRYTTEALEGRIRHDAIGGLDVEALGHDAVMHDWMAGCKPIAISGARYAELWLQGLSGVTEASGIVRGVTHDPSGLSFPWVLIPIARCMQTPAYAAAIGTEPPENGYGLFVDYTYAGTPFIQQTPGGATPIRVLGYDSVLGLINPDSAHLGYRACVTGDYDLFGVWAPFAKEDPFAAKTRWDDRIVDRYREQNPETEIAHHFQHYKLGNITGRLNMVKVLLNTALIGKSKYTGGNLIHHSDEIGNPSPGLQKTLSESFPILAFLPSDKWTVAGVDSVGMCMTTVEDFVWFARACLKAHIAPELRPEWRPLFY
jgi:hypothetical protein